MGSPGEWFENNDNAEMHSKATGGGWPHGAWGPTFRAHPMRATTDCPLFDRSARFVIGHRGAPAIVPENTLPSFQAALDAGALAIECDVRLTRDGVAVIHHDPTTDRTAGAPGVLADLPWDALARYDAGGAARHRGVWHGEALRIPSLAEVLQAFPTVPFLFELKVRGCERVVSDLLARHGAAGHCAVAAFDGAAVQGFAGTTIAVGASRAEIVRLLVGATLHLPLSGLPARALYSVPDRAYGVPVPTRAFVRAAHRRGAPVHVWTVDDPARANALWALGVSGVLTNAPDRLRRRDGR